MPPSRRDFLRAAGLTVGALPALNLIGCGEAIDPGPAPDPGPSERVYPELDDYTYDGELGPETLFSHSVASGDPLTDAVILWTRVTTEGGEPVEVWWEIAEDTAFERRLGAGSVTATADTDWTVKIDATGLYPGETYYYRFFCLGQESPMGRTKTAPQGEHDRTRFAFCSCSNYTRGFFLSYREIGQMADLDLVLHLGDYIYEYGSGGQTWRPGPETMTDLERRVHDPPREITTLEDYRRRYAQYRTDTNLQDAHRQHPFVLVWDDHESANDAWQDGAQNHDEAIEGVWADRLTAAQRAWLEWMPARPGPDGRIWRSFSYGDLFDLIMLDTRIWGRDEQSNDPDLIASTQRSLLGDDQETWMLDTLRDSTASWRILGQQVMVSHLRTPSGPPLNTDQWDGYEASRAKLFDAIAADDDSNLVVLTGDIHTSWANNLVDDPDAADPTTLAVEFVAPGVTSTGLSDNPVFVRSVRRSNPHIAWAELSKRGYVVVDVTHERVQAAWHHFEGVDDPEGVSSFAAAYHVPQGAPELIADEDPAPPPEEVAELAP